MNLQDSSNCINTCKFCKLVVQHKTNDVYTKEDLKKNCIMYCKKCDNYIPHHSHNDKQHNNKNKCNKNQNKYQKDKKSNKCHKDKCKNDDYKYQNNKDKHQNDKNKCKNDIDLCCIKGDKGDRGSKGKQGSPGPCGRKGDKGDRGEMGLRGYCGLKGDKGERGPCGSMYYPKNKGCYYLNVDQKLHTSYKPLTCPPTENGCYLYCVCDGEVHYQPFSIQTFKTITLNTCISIGYDISYDSDITMIQIIQTPKHGTLVNNVHKKKLIYTSNSNFLGLDFFSYVFKKSTTDMLHQDNYIVLVNGEQKLDLNNS